jgi:hypothetical protein
LSRPPRLSCLYGSKPYVNARRFLSEHTPQRYTPMGSLPTKDLCIICRTPTRHGLLLALDVIVSVGPVLRIKTDSSEGSMHYACLQVRLTPKLAKDSYQGTALAVPPSSACRFPERAPGSRGIPPSGPSTTDVILRKRRLSLVEACRRRIYAFRKSHGQSPTGLGRAQL